VRALPLADPTLGDVDQAVDHRHEGRQVAGIDATLGKTRAEEFEHFAPLADGATPGASAELGALRGRSWEAMALRGSVDARVLNGR
jgi:hypothetical protein